MTFPADLSLVRHQIGVSLALITALVLAYAAYTPALSGPFLLDDFHNIGALDIGVDTTDDLREFLFKPGAGPTGRPLARLSFLIDDYAWPTSAADFKHTNLLLHLLCGVLIFALARQMLAYTRCPPHQAAWLALGVAALWLLHPFNLSTVMYAVQRMTQLATLFTLATCVSYLALRPAAATGRTGALAGITVTTGLFTVLGVFSKENAATVLLLLAALEFTVLRDTPTSRRFRQWRGLVLVLPAIALLAYLAWIPRWLPGYETRGFTLAQRLMTEPVILLEYLYHILSLRTLGIGVMHDDQTVRTTLLDPTALVAALFWLGALGLAFGLRRRVPLLAFSIFWFMGAHAIESTTISLELYFEHRNYLPMIGPLIGLVAGIDALATHATVSRVLTTSFLVVFVMMAGAQTRLLATPWGKADELVLLMATEHPDSLRATRTLARWMEFFLQHRQALDVLDKTFAEKYPRDLSLPLISIDISCAKGLPRRYDLRELAANMHRYDFTDGLAPTVVSLRQTIAAGKCRELSAPLSALLEKTPELRPRISSASLRMAKLLRMNASYLMNQGDFRAARRNLHKAYELYPRATIAFELAQMWMRFGDYRAALAWLERTEELERESRHPLRPDISETFAAKRAMLEGLVNEQQQQGAEVAPGREAQEQ